MTKVVHENILDELEDAIRTAHGIEAALYGLECLNDLMKTGVTWLQTMNIEALEAVRDRLAKAHDQRSGAETEQAA